MGHLSQQLRSVGVLADGARRALYEYVLAQTGPVSRDQAAEGVGTPAHSAKFHLDKLAAAGLLDVEYRRISGRTGPGAGRPAKLYRRSDREVSLSVPPRRYDLAGEVLAEAVDRSVAGGRPVVQAVPEVAREVGRRLATEHVATGEPSAADELDRTAEVLEQHGYEPQVGLRELCLANCPFDRLAAEHTELVCGLNVALVDGVLDGLGADSLKASLEPRPGWCCVTVSRTG